jgi:hypothetical protein
MTTFVIKISCKWKQHVFSIRSWNVIFVLIILFPRLIVGVFIILMISKRPKMKGLNHQIILIPIKKYLIQLDSIVSWTHYVSVCVCVCVCVCVVRMSTTYVLLFTTTLICFYILSLKNYQDSLGVLVWAWHP